MVRGRDDQPMPESLGPQIQSEECFFLLFPVSESPCVLPGWCLFLQLLLFFMVFCCCCTCEDWVMFCGAAFSFPLPVYSLVWCSEWVIANRKVDDRGRLERPLFLFAQIPQSSVNGSMCSFLIFSPNNDNNKLSDAENKQAGKQLRPAVRKGIGQVIHHLTLAMKSFLPNPCCLLGFAEGPF